MNIVLFQGANASNHPGLWETNGTTSGTFELTPITERTLRGSLLELHSLQRDVLFSGVDANGLALWVTNGTAAGTRSEVAGTSAFTPNNLTVFNGRVLFNGGSGLWTTNGTAAGTSELAGRRDESDRPHSFQRIRCCSVVVSGGLHGLWTTNGVAGGTHELAGRRGADDGPWTKSVRPHGLWK